MYEVLALLATIVAAFLVFNLHRSPLFAVYFVLAVGLAKAWFVVLPGIELGIMLYPIDVVGLLLALAAFTRVVARQSLRMSVSGLVFAAMLVFSFLSGLTEYGETAGVDFRTTFTFIAAVIYFATFRINSELADRVMRVWIFAAFALMLIAWLVWIADAAGFAMAKKWTDAEPIVGLELRVLHADSTYIIGVGVVVLLYLLINGRVTSRWWLMLSALGATVLILQHRSVWVATFCSAVLLIFLVRRGRSRVVLYCGAITLIALATTPLISQRFSAVAESVSLQFERATDLTEGTSGARVNAWELLLKDWQNLGLGRQLIGKPFGSSYGGLPNSPHNGYLQVMYRTGYVGLLAMLAMFGATLVRLLRKRQGEEKRDTDAAILVFVLVVGQLIYLVPYGFSTEQGVLMGVAIGYVGSKSLRRSTPALQ